MGNEKPEDWDAAAWPDRLSRIGGQLDAAEGVLESLAEKVDAAELGRLRDRIAQARARMMQLAALAAPTDHGEQFPPIWTSLTWPSGPLDPG